MGKSRVCTKCKGRTFHTSLGHIQCSKCFEPFIETPVPHIKRAKPPITKG